jgi:hypothetical protein
LGTARAQIENLMALCWRLYDDGNWDTYAELFRDAVVIGGMGNTNRTPEEMLAYHYETILLHDGAVKVRHVVSNVEIEVNDSTGTATAHSYVTIYQALPDFPLQPVYVGGFADKFVWTGEHGGSPNGARSQI